MAIETSNLCVSMPYDGVGVSAWSRARCGGMSSRRRAWFILPFSLVISGATQAAPDDGAASAPLAAVPADVTAAPANDSPRVVRRSRAAFGTDVQMMALSSGDAEARRTAAHLEAAFGELERVAALVDGSREQSDVSRLNRAAGGEPVVVSPEVFGLLSEAKRVAGLSSGAFDPTFAPLDEVWRFSAGAGAEGSAPEPPSDEDIEQRRALVGHADLVLDAARRTAALKKQGQSVGLEGIAKGFALERAASLLDERGVKHFVLAAGGDVVVRGTHGDRPWRVGIQDPRAPGHFAATTVEGGAVMTTGDYERFFTSGDKRYHHVLDPRTGKPAQGARSVTVFAEDAAMADALSTAVFVLGPTKGLALVKRLKGVEAVVVTEDNRVIVTPGLKEVLTWRPPTDAP